MALNLDYESQRMEYGNHRMDYENTDVKHERTVSSAPDIRIFWAQRPYLSGLLHLPLIDSDGVFVGLVNLQLEGGGADGGELYGVGLVL